MALQASTHSSHWDEDETEVALKPFLPAHFGISNTNQMVVKTAEYIGSFMVSGKGHHDRAEIVRQKLEAARTYTHSKPIVLMISLNGIKVCRDTDKHVYMAHALRRISYATCDPENLQFAFLAREPKAEPNIQYCHAFVTSTPEQAEELNNIVGEAFRIAYTQQQLALLTEQFRHVSTNPPEPNSPCQNQMTPTSAPSTACCVATANGSGSPVTVTSSASHSSPLRSAIHPTMLNKPLPPVPAASIKMTDGLVADNDVPQIDPPLPPPPPTDVVDAHRGNRPHKHHKHHKHRHRHRAKDVSAQAPEHIQDHHSVDSGLHTGTGESSASLPTDFSHQLPTAAPKNPAISQRHQPPPPPPRGHSSLVPSQTSEMDSRIPNHSYSPCVEQEFRRSNGEPVQAGSDAKAKLQTRSLSDALSPATHQLPFIKTSATNSLQSISGELCDGNIARPSSQASRPVSQHFYDMADHRSCGAVPPEAVVSKSESIPSSSAEIAEVPANIPCSTTTSGFTATSSSTTGCSTATSGSNQSGSGSASSVSRKRTEEGHLGVTSEHICRHSGDNREQQYSAHSTGSSRHSRISDSGFRHALDESAELAQASWYQPQVPREVALELLSRQPPGSFVIRDSGSHANCYALSVRFGEGASRCSLSGTPTGGVLGSSSRDLSGLPVYPHPTSGISHFLIQRTTRGGVRLKGLDKEWPSLSCLVLHLTVIPEMLPCPLMLPKASANPAFSPSDHGGDNTPCHRPHFEQAPATSCVHFRPIRCPESAVALGDEDEDYQRLSDFSSIMADLRQRPRAPARSRELRRVR